MTIRSRPGIRPAVLTLAAALSLAAGPATEPATRPAEADVPAAAAPTYVFDDARVFTPQTIAAAEAAVGQMQRQYHKALVVETFAAVPDADRPAVADDRAGYFKRWMHARFANRNVNGVYVLVCLDPRYVEVGVGKQTLARGDFTPADVAGLSKQLIADLRGGRYDVGLAGAVDTVGRDYAANIPGGQPLDPPPQTGP